VFLSFSKLLRYSPPVFVSMWTCCGFIVVALYRQNYDLLSCYSIGRHIYIITVAAIYSGVK
jgi:hypothetical protein